MVLQIQRSLRGEFFAITHKSDAITYYLIAITAPHTYTLTNLGSGYTNYSADTVPLLVEDYLAKQSKGPKVTQPTGYFFVKGYKVHSAIQDTFGYVSLLTEGRE